MSKLFPSNRLTKNQSLVLINGYNRNIEKLLNGQCIPIEINYLSLKFYYMSEELENKLKCTISYINGHSLILNNNDICITHRHINVLDMGRKSLLTTKSVYKDTQFKQMYQWFANVTNIPLDNLMIYNYTERKNGTLRPNRRIKFDLNENFNNNDSYKYDRRTIISREIPTIPCKKYVKSIYNRIGNVQDKKRDFLLLDRTKICTLGNINANSKNKYARQILCGLKYFDIFAQKLYFVDWLLIHTESIKFSDMIEYIEKTLVSNTKHNRLYFNKLYNYLQEINEYETKTNTKCETLVVFEEECVVKNGDKFFCKVSCENIKSYDTISDEFFNGDIFVFQLSPFHPYLLEKITKKPNIIAIVSDFIKSQCMYEHNNNNSATIDNHIPFVSHMTYNEVNRLDINDKIDYMDNDGKFVCATVCEKLGTRLKIRYNRNPGHVLAAERCIWIDFSIDRHKIAFKGSISSRPAHRLKDLGVKSAVYFKENIEWRRGCIIELDEHSGQVRIHWQSMTLAKKYIFKQCWRHLDDINSIASDIGYPFTRHTRPCNASNIVYSFNKH